VVVPVFRLGPKLAADWHEIARRRALVLRSTCLGTIRSGGRFNAAEGVVGALCQRGRIFSALPMDAYGDRGQRDLSSENSRPLPEKGHRLMPAFLRIEKTSVREALVNFVEELSTRRTRSSANEAAGLSAADSETHRRQEHHMYIWDCARSPARPPVHPRHSFRVKPQTTKQKHKDEALHSRSDARTLGAEAEHRNPRRS